MTNLLPAHSHAHSALQSSYLSHIILPAPLLLAARLALQLRQTAPAAKLVYRLYQGDAKMKKLWKERMALRAAGGDPTTRP
eukprot:SAG11_NODE_37340_length_257_cov_0.936709_1_plen_80_part_10